MSKFKKNARESTPFISEKILKFLLPEIDREGMIGDFKEMYCDVAGEHGRIWGWLWYWMQITKLLPPFIMNMIYRSTFMFKNYLKIALRILAKNRTYSYINIGGLTLSLTAVLVMMLYIKDELSYDRFNSKADNIYRLTDDMSAAGMGQTMSISQSVIADFLAEGSPAVLGTARFIKENTLPTGSTELPFSYKNKKFMESSLMITDAHVFDIFDFQLVKGDPNTALEKPKSLLVTEDMAAKYFGTEDPVNKVLIIGAYGDFTVTGVLKNIKNSHLTFDFLTNITSFSPKWDMNAHWTWTYFLLQDGTDTAALAETFPAILEAKGQWAGRYNTNHKLGLQPLTDIHLKSDLQFESEEGGDIVYVYVFSIVALLIMSIAGINFMNLATARSVARAKEVGVRKVLGAKKGQLLKQFLSESILMSLLGLLFAIAIAKLLLPVMNDLAGRELSFATLLTGWEAFALLGLVLLLGTVSGLYPALFLSSYKPVNTFRGIFTTGGKNISVRKIFVILQFSICISLLIGTGVILSQSNYLINKKKLGFNKDQILSIPISDKTLIAKADVLKQELLDYPSIESFSVVSNMPGNKMSMPILSFTPEGERSNERILASAFVGDDDFIETFDIKIIDGHNIPKEAPGDGSSFLINEAAAKAFGWDSPVGMQLSSNNFRAKGPVVGVVEDFHFVSLHERIQPLVIFKHDTQMKGTFAVKVNTEENIRETIDHISSVFSKHSSEYPFSYTFLSDDFNALYMSEIKFGRILTYFSALAIIIACLGLFGIVSFTADQRVNEISIRKVLGADVSSIIKMITRDFLILIVAANVLAWPAAYFATASWLEGFPYRIGTPVNIFMIATFAALAIAILTIIVRSFRAAASNPIHALRPN